MKIPDGKSGHPTVSTNQFRIYGTAGFTLDEHEQSRGCPRQYHARYVEKRVKRESTYALEYGSFFHDVMFLLEEGDVSPDEAIEKAFPVGGTPEMLREARADLQAYLERPSSPRDRLATVATELDFEVPLFVDDEYGEIWFRAIVDRVSVDPEVPGVVYIEDYKTNRFPPSTAAVRGDVQLKGYAWAVKQHAEQIGLDPNSRFVVILNAVKWREIEVAVTDEVMDDWHTWAVAVTRTILRDDEAKPVVNPGCDWCPVRSDCPAFQELPEASSRLLVALGGIDDLQTRLRWRNRANEVRLRLDKAVKEIDAEINAVVMQESVLEIGSTRFEVEPKWENQWDARGLHAVLGDQFYDVVTVGKGKVDEIKRSLDPSTLADVEATFQRVPEGTRITKKEIGDGDVVR